MKPKRAASILLVEDDDIAAETVHRAFSRAHVANPIYRARDGLEALDALRGTGARDAISRPLVVLLDLRMPRMGGLKFLEELRRDPDIADTVVFMLTTSSDQNDRLAAYRHHVAGYIVKSQLEHDLGGLIELLEAYWKVVEFPDHQEARTA